MEKHIAYLPKLEFVKSGLFKNYLVIDPKWTKKETEAVCKYIETNK